MKPGDRVRARYFDANDVPLKWDGVLKEQVGKCWRVDVGGVTIMFNTDDIEVVNEKATEGPVTG